MSGKNSALAVSGALAMAVVTWNAPVSKAQTPAFSVSSVRPGKPGDTATSNFPLGAGDVYVRNGGLFSASGYPLLTYIGFAYKVIGNQAQFLVPQLPDWAKTEPFDIQARAEGDPGKDQMRLMMRSLLADRFQLATHYENRDVPVFALVLAKSGKTGPQLRPHSDSTPCPTEQPSASTPAVVDGLPVFCNGVYPLPPSAPGRLRFGGRNLTIAFIADTFSPGTNLGRPMIDGTGLSGRFDFTLEWAPARPGAAGGDIPADPAGPSFEEALRDQWGVKLQAEKSAVPVLVIDHVARPSAN